ALKVVPASGFVIERSAALIAGNQGGIREIFLPVEHQAAGRGGIAAPKVKRSDGVFKIWIGLKRICKLLISQSTELSSEMACAVVAGNDQSRNAFPGFFLGGEKVFKLLQIEPH